MFVSPWELPKGLVGSKNNRLSYLSCWTPVCSSMKEFVRYRLNLCQRCPLLGCPDIRIEVKIANPILLRIQIL